MAMRQAKTQLRGGSMRLSSRKIAYGVLTAVGAILANAALVLAAADQAAAAESNAAAEGEGASLEEIVVSARRREESIQSTPVSVSVVGLEGLEAKAAVNLGDLQGSI